MPPVGQTIRQGLIACAVLLVAGWSALAVALETGPREVVVQVDRLNLRPQPGTGGTALRQLNRGSRLTILETGPEWLKVRYRDTIGYVRNRERYLDTSRPWTAPGKSEMPLTKNWWPIARPCRMWKDAKTSSWTVWMP